MSELTNFVFDAEDGTPRAVRTVMIDGEPWFVAKDVCAVLGLKNSRDAIERLDDDEKGVANTDTLGGTQELSTVNESGLYALIFTSRKPEAKRFKKWVTAEVLPSIRKTGAYVGPEAQLAAQPPQTLFLSHGADILVAADRTFRTVIRSGRAAGLSTAQAIRRANQVTRERTGVDMLAELQAEDHVAGLEAPARASKGLGAAWVPASVRGFWEEMRGGDLADLDGQPMLSTQLHQLYLHWCSDQQVLAVTLPRLVSALVRAGLMRAARKRYVAEAGAVVGPHAFLIPAELLGAPAGRYEPEWLGECVARVNETLESLQA